MTLHCDTNTPATSYDTFLSYRLIVLVRYIKFAASCQHIRPQRDALESPTNPAKFDVLNSKCFWEKSFFDVTNVITASTVTTLTYVTTVSLNEKSQKIWF